MSVDDVLQKLAAFPQQHGAANGSRIFDGDAEKGIRQPAIADLFRDEPKRFRAPLQVMRFVRKLHREMPIAAKTVCGEPAKAAQYCGAARANENAEWLEFA
jgi:hypothetical protein